MVSLPNHVTIPLMLNTRRQTAIATATRLPRPRNDKPPSRACRRIMVSPLNPDEVAQDEGLPELLPDCPPSSPGI